MKKLWCIADRKDAEMTSLYSCAISANGTLPTKLRPQDRALRHWTIPPLPPSFLTYLGPQWTAIEEETNKRGEGEGKRAGSDTWKHDSQVVVYNGFNGRL